MNAWTLPVCVTVGGQPRAVYTDYRDILYLLNWLDGPRGAALRPDERWYVALALFYRDFAALDPALYPEAAAALAAFLAAGQPAAPAGPRLIDWQKDAGLIVAGVNRAAGCEVRALPYLHWWSFIAWFAAIGEGALATVVAIREKLARGKRLEGWELEHYRAHRAQIDLRPEPTAAERAEKERLLRMLDGKRVGMRNEELAEGNWRNVNHLPVIWGKGGVMASHGKDTDV